MVRASQGSVQSSPSTLGLAPMKEASVSRYTSHSVFRISSKVRPNLNEPEKRKRQEEDLYQQGLEELGWRSSAPLVLLHLECNWVLFRKGLDVGAAGTCDTDPAHDTAPVK